MHVFLDNPQSLLSLADTSTIRPSFCIVKRTTYFVMDLHFIISINIDIYKYRYL